MKRNRRILSLLLAICLVAALIPTAVFAEAALSNAATNGQVVHYGSKDWIVADNNSSEMVLLLQTPEAPIAYDASGLSNAWDTSDAKAWCESDEVRGWFSAVEWNALSEEKVYFLSHSEVVTYFANSTLSDLKTENGWWLRYDGEGVDSPLFGIAVSDAGFVGTPHVATNYGARPAIKIPAENIAMIELVEGIWNLKVVDSNFKGMINNVGVSEDYSSVTATYSDATAGDVYFVLTDRAGKFISSYSVPVSGASGTATWELPDDLVGWYSVRAFIADENTNTTSAVVKKDFAIKDSHGNVVEWNVNVGGDISANFNIELAEGVEKEDATVVVSYNGVTKEVPFVDLESGVTTGGTACFKLPVDLNAPQMTDEISIQVVSKEGSGGEQVFTIREYAEAIINGNFDDATKDLVKHMLNYGAKAQTYFNYKAKDLANKNSGVPAQETVPNDGQAAVKPNTVEGISFYGASLVLNSQTTLRFYFTLAEGKNISDYKFGELNVQAKVVGGTTMYFVDIVDIAPDKLNELYSVSVNDVVIVEYNPMWYIKRQYHNENNATKFTDLLQAMYNYYLAAFAYAN